MRHARRKDIAIQYIVPSIALIAIVLGLVIRPKFLLNDVFVYAGLSIIVGMRSAAWVRNIFVQKSIAILAMIAILVAAWVRGFGVVHDPDVFFTRPTVYTILIIGLSIGWALVASGLHTRLRYNAPEVHWTLEVGKRRHWPVFIAICFALFFAFYHLTGLNFQNDEYYHIEAAQGYLRSGEPFLWNFASDSAKISPITGEPILYDRAIAYTAQVIATAKIFGLSEFSARLPAVVWYVLLSACVYGAAYLFSRRRSLALITALTLISFDHVMLYGRIVRMYSMTMVLALSMIGLFYLLYVEWVRPRVSGVKITCYIILLGACTALAASVHLITIMLVPAFCAFLCVETLLSMRAGQTLYHPQAVRRLRILVLIIGVGLLVALVGLYVSHQAITEYFIGIRKDANLPYFFFPVQDASIPVLALVLFVASFVYARGSRSLRYMTVINLFVVYAFVYIVTRYAAPRYMLFILPLVLMQIMLVLYELSNALIPHNCRSLLRTLCASVVCVVAIMPLSSFIPLDRFAIAQTPRFDRTHANGYGHDIRESYAFARENMKKDDVLITIDFRSFYFQESDQQVIELPKNKELSLEEFQTLLAEHPHAWVIIPQAKLRHLTDAVREYLVTTGTDRSVVGTRVFIYSFSF